MATTSLYIVASAGFVHGPSLFPVDVFAPAFVANII